MFNKFKREIILPVKTEYLDDGIQRIYEFEGTMWGASVIMRYETSYGGKEGLWEIAPQWGGHLEAMDRAIHPVGPQGKTVVNLWKWSLEHHANRAITPPALGSSARPGSWLTTGVVAAAHRPNDGSTASSKPR